MRVYWYRIFKKKELIEESYTQYESAEEAEKEALNFIEKEIRDDYIFYGDELEEDDFDFEIDYDDYDDSDESYDWYN